MTAQTLEKWKDRTSGQLTKRHTSGSKIIRIFLVILIAVCFMDLASARRRRGGNSNWRGSGQYSNRNRYKPRYDDYNWHTDDYSGRGRQHRHHHHNHHDPWNPDPWTPDPWTPDPWRPDRRRRKCKYDCNFFDHNNSIFSRYYECFNPKRDCPNV